MASSPPWTSAVVIAALIGTAACTPIPFPIPGADAGSDGGIVVEPTLTDIQKKIFNVGCSQASCHGGMTPQAGLDLKDGGSFSNLVNVSSVYADTDTVDGGLILVVPGHPEQSFLMDKLDKTDAELAARGHRAHMPYNSPQLPAAHRDAIREWITDGALNN